MAIQGTLPVKLWGMNNQGFTQNTNSPVYQLCRQYLSEMNFCDDSEFDHSLDCEYLDNFCHVEPRGPYNFFRPSKCTKFPLKKAAWVFADPKYRTSYHGTASCNVRSILRHGLVPAGEQAGGQLIRKKNGEKLGYGVYTSPSPMYAQLYAPLECWRGKYVQTVLMVRQPARDIVTYSDEGCASVALIGRNDLWRLYGGVLSRGELQMKTTCYKEMVIQAVVIKIHDQDPTAPGGEYYKVRAILSQVNTTNSPKYSQRIASVRKRRTTIRLIYTGEPETRGTPCRSRQSPSIRASISSSSFGSTSIPCD
jgi:hypothetical protein